MSIDSILEALDVRMEPFAICELHGSSTMNLGRRPFAVLHYVIAGSGCIVVGNAPRIDVQPGSVVLTPAFVPHRLHGSGLKGRPIPLCRPIDLGLDHHVAGNGGESSDNNALVTICGHLEVSYRGLRGALNVLKRPIVEHLAAGDRVRNALDEFVYELSNPTVGTRALARSLMSQCVIQLLRRRHRAGDAAVTWMEGAADETLWNALQAMLDHPGRAHTVDTLAEACGMARSSFAGRFVKVYGLGPIELLRSIRMQRAAELLSHTGTPVKRVAELVGYQSRSYFSRAFEEEYGVAPSQFRSATLRREQNRAGPGPH